MAFRAQTYRVLIASPSDLAEERVAVVEAINDWNEQHAVSESIVLLPLRHETQSLPELGTRPQAAINRQLVQDSDILIAMFWTKFGTNTGVAESGTAEEIDQFVANRKPGMLYFSSRPVDPNKINLSQLAQLKDFKEDTYKKALTGRFNSVDELRRIVSRDLMKQVRVLGAHRRITRSDKLEEAQKITELISSHKSQGITAEEFQMYGEMIGVRRQTKVVTTDPLRPGEVGPNGFPVGYTKEGDKVEWIPEEDSPEGLWPMILRRNDRAIQEALGEFWDKVWWNRKQNYIWELENGDKATSEETQQRIATIKKACAKVERKYGKRNLGWDDFEWGLLSGKLSALAWVMGSEWEGSFDT
jgi:hypothetical protein